MKNFFKLFSFLSVIFFGTWYFIRKADKLSLNIQESVKNNLTIEKNYKSIGYYNSHLLDSNEKERFHSIEHLKKATDENEISTAIHKYRINDTLYSIRVFFDKDYYVLAIDTPKKAF